MASDSESVDISLVSLTVRLMMPQRFEPNHNMAHRTQN